jgi:GNAT superfamily N-acetyltransferase
MRDHDPVQVTVADCERVQSDWFAARAKAGGGAVWTDDSVTVTDGPDGLNLMFPTVIAAAPVARVVALATERDLSIVGAWLGLEVDADVLADAGFERGWSPWWMTAPLAEVGTPDDRRITVERRGSGWYAEAHTPDGRFAGQAWSHLADGLAGIFDMEVWAPFQRQGYGTGLLRAVCAAAASAGAEHAVLNATPMGTLLYEAAGFVQIGEGITWWRHSRPFGR